MSGTSIDELRAELARKEEEIKNLRKLCQKQEAQLSIITQGQVCDDSGTKHDIPAVTRLSNEDISRYSRQLILPEFGVKGQIKLRNSSVLIIGAGGLGCPAAVYLAAAGIGKLGVVDYDEVELSNLHRQILHTTDRVGVLKSLSIAQSCFRLNPSVEYVPYHLQLNSSNALEIIKQFDIVLDATDNVATRYLLNDACVLAGKPLISGSALRFEGQLTVYNCDGGPCYRCLFPKPPPPETVTNCSEGGVIGVVPGIIGSIQALEAIKMSAGLGTSYTQRLLLFDALDGTFRSVKLRPKSVECCVCGEKPSIVQLVDYEQFCGARATDKDKELHLLADSSRISAKEYATLLKDNKPHVLVDVRPAVEMEICKLPHPALNIPITNFSKNPTQAASTIRQAMDEAAVDMQNKRTNQMQVPVILVCRRGNDSQLAVQKLQQEMANDGIHLVDIRGGLYAWTRQVDAGFPTY